MILGPATLQSVLSHFSCSHASREIVLHLSRKMVLPYKTSVSRPKKQLSLQTFWRFFLTHVLSHIIFPYPLIKIQHELYNLPPFITILEPCYKIKYTTYKMIWMSRHIPRYSTARVPSSVTMKSLSM